MKRTLQIALVMGALLLPLDAIAEPYWTAKPVQCGTLEEIIDITKQFGETPSIIMKGYMKVPSGQYVESKVVIAMNMSTESWTLIEFPKNVAIGCIVATGRGFEKLVDIGTSL